MSRNRENILSSFNGEIRRLLTGNPKEALHAKRQLAAAVPRIALIDQREADKLKQMLKRVRVK